MQKRIALKQYGLIVILSIVTAIGLNNIIMLFDLARYSERYQEAARALYAPTFAWQILYTGILMPILEELVFRGLVYRTLRRWIPFWGAMLVSAVLFAFYHGNLVQFVYAFLCGLLLAYFFEKSGSIFAPILAHMVMNLVACIMTEWGIFSWMFQSGIRVIVITVFCVGMFLFFMRKSFLHPKNGCYKNVK